MVGANQFGKRSLINPQSSSVKPKIIVIGLGNPILGDDGVGWRIADQVLSRLESNNNPDSNFLNNLEIEIDNLAVGGLRLMEHLIGYQHAIIIDAISTNTKPQGTVSQYNLEDLPDFSANHLGSAHDASLQTAIQVGRTMGATLPEDIKVVSIESKAVYDFSEDLTPAILAAIPKAEKIVYHLLEQWVK